MHTIMAPYGAVNRIVIFTKRGVQALVEFADPASAARAQVCATSPCCWLAPPPPPAPLARGWFAR